MKLCSGFAICVGEMTSWAGHTVGILGGLRQPPSHCVFDMQRPWPSVGVFRNREVVINAKRRLIGWLGLAWYRMAVLGLDTCPNRNGEPRRRFHNVCGVGLVVLLGTRCKCRWRISAAETTRLKLRGCISGRWGKCSKRTYVEMMGKVGR